MRVFSAGAVGISGGGVEVEGPERQQGLFDDMVKFVGCDGAANKIQCLRDAPYEKIYQHAQTVNYFLGYRNLASAWTLRPDGKFLTESPDKLVAEGKIANVPIIYGDMRDEVALFSLINALNTTTADEVIDYFKTYWCPKATKEQLQKIIWNYTETIRPTAPLSAPASSNSAHNSNVSPPSPATTHSKSNVANSSTRSQHQSGTTLPSKPFLCRSSTTHLSGPSSEAQEPPLSQFLGLSTLRMLFSIGLVRCLGV
jgi:hypothetical protein